MSERFHQVTALRRMVALMDARMDRLKSARDRWAALLAELENSAETTQTEENNVSFGTESEELPGS